MVGVLNTDPNINPKTWKIRSLAIFAPPDRSGGTRTMGDASSSANLRKEQNLVKLERELEFRIDLFSGLVKTCFNKCIDRRYKETELYIGENSCIDRCTAKYVQASNMIGQILASQKPSS